MDFVFFSGAMISDQTTRSWGFWNRSTPGFPWWPWLPQPTWGSVKTSSISWEWRTLNGSQQIHNQNIRISLCEAYLDNSYCPFFYVSFVQSFNRPNLKFRVEPKKPSTLTADITKLIKEQFSGKCGIVYCLSRFARILTILKLSMSSQISLNHM